MDRPKQNESSPERRRFLQRGTLGAGLLGIGSWLGLLNGDVLAEKPVLPRLSQGRALGKEFTYDADSLLMTDPRFIEYEETGKLDVGGKDIQGLFLSANRQLYVAVDNRIVLFSPDGSRSRDFNLPESPRCVAVSPEGLMWVGFKRHVEVLDAQGVRKAKWDDAGEKAILTSIAVANEHVFVADAGNRIVLHYDRSGKLLGKIGKKDARRNVPGFIVPSPYFDLEVGPEGLLWVANTGRHQIEAYTFDGDLEYAWGEASTALSGFCGCCNPIHFTRLPDGRFVTSEKGIPRVKVYSAKGAFESVVAGPEQFPRYRANTSIVNPAGLDVAADSAGRVWVADSMTGAVRAFSRIKKERVL